MSDDRPTRTPPKPLRVPLWAGLAALALVTGVVVANALGLRVPPGEVACPAIGYSHSLEVTLAGDTSAVAHVQVWDDAAWQPPVEWERVGGTEECGGPHRGHVSWTL